MQLDQDFLTRFLVCRAAAESADPDTTTADRLALAASMLNTDLIQSVLLARVLAASRAPAATGGIFARLRIGGRRAHAAAPARERVKVPNVRHLSDPEQISAHLHQHGLHPRIHREAVAEIKAPRVLRQWPEEGTDADAGDEINVLLLVPENGHHGEPEPRAPTRK